MNDMMTFWSQFDEEKDIAGTALLRVLISFKKINDVSITLRSNVTLFVVRLQLILTIIYSALYMLIVNTKH